MRAPFDDVRLILRLSVVSRAEGSVSIFLLQSDDLLSLRLLLVFHETCHSVTFYFMKKDSEDAVTPQRQSQVTPKMKANTVTHLLSSLV